MICTCVLEKNDDAGEIDFEVSPADHVVCPPWVLDAPGSTVSVCLKSSSYGSSFVKTSYSGVTCRVRALNRAEPHSEGTFAVTQMALEVEKQGARRSFA